LERLVAQKRKLTDEACAVVIRNLSAKDQTTLLCWSACVRRYKAARAPILQYLLGSEFKTAVASVELTLSSDEWTLTDVARLGIRVVPADSSHPRRFTLRLNTVGKFDREGDNRDTHNRAFIVWTASDEREYWQTLAGTHRMRPEAMFADTLQDLWISPPLDIAVAADVLSAFLWGAERGVIDMDARHAFRGPTETMTVQVNPGLIVWPE
jgi:hypothetical protein